VSADTDHDQNNTGSSPPQFGHGGCGEEPPFTVMEAALRHRGVLLVSKSDGAWVVTVATPDCLDAMDVAAAALGMLDGEIEAAVEGGVDA